MRIFLAVVATFPASIFAKGKTRGKPESKDQKRSISHESPQPVGLEAKVSLDFAIYTPTESVADFPAGILQEGVTAEYYLARGWRAGLTAAFGSYGKEKSSVNFIGVGGSYFPWDTSGFFVQAMLGYRKFHHTRVMDFPGVPNMEITTSSLVHSIGLGNRWMPRGSWILEFNWFSLEIVDLVLSKKVDPAEFLPLWGSETSEKSATAIAEMPMGYASVRVGYFFN